MERRGFILVVDPDPDDLTVTVGALRQAGVEAPVVMVRDGAEARECVRGSPTPPLLVMTEVHLPNRSGLELVALLRETHADVPVIVWAARASEEEMVLGIQRGASACIAKPEAYEELLETVRQIARFWL